MSKRTDKVDGAGRDGGLAAVLRSVAFSSAVFSRAELSAPWAVSTRALPVGIFHAVIRGSASIEVDGKTLSLAAGDAVFLPAGTAHVIRDRPDTRTRAINISDLPGRRDGTVDVVTSPGEGAQTDILCATFSLGSSAVHPLFNGLGKTWVLRGGDDAAVVDIIRLLDREVSSHAVVGAPLAERLAESLVLVAVRRAADQPATQGWLRGLSDPPVARALACIHEEPEREWTADRLAKAVGMSRSTFYSRFSTCTGESPSSYLAQWRMHIAAGLLRAGASVGEVSARVGYGSEAAFGKAFKRVVGRSPGTLRP